MSEVSTTEQPRLSLVIPVMNEEDNIAPMLEQIEQALAEETYEVIFVDDGSSDATVRRLREHDDERVRTLVLNRNYGQTTAMAAGIDAAEGQYVVTLDGDLQNDPADIPLMLQKLEAEGLDVVAGRRANRQDGMLLRKIPSRIANAMIRRLTGVYLYDYGCTLKVFKAEEAQELGLYGQLHRFIPVLAHMQGAVIGEMDVRHHARIHGKSKYGLSRTFKVMSDLVLMVFFQKYLPRPMHLFGTLGLITFITGMLINLYLLGEKLLGYDIWGRPLLLLGVSLVLGGIQLVTFGLMAEMLMRTYYESQSKKTYRVKSDFRGHAG
ncbi:MAG TPA: glycosyltransferase [Cytophagales bacterium]|nr:glycosyltransferase [Cytophagales bacterium]HAP63541.1 glycosyltransferase [Cytophagales bacterium]